ncbi:unnamed protein product [Periconia digitata]|uniref:Uncharacterized protein n=1 Tax=Periconia digitata TaxID=1303443 RepID=A0A9W4UP48_9PLEO|nr:unnamed protein product [Periconia digitata]
MLLIYTTDNANRQSPTLRRRDGGEVGLVLDNQSSHAGTRQGGNDTGEQSTKGKTGYITTAGGRDLRQHTNLGTERTNVSETTDGVGSNEPGARGEIVVRGIGILCGDESVEGHKLVGDDLDTDETSDKEQFLDVALDSEQESDGQADVTENELESQVVLALQPNITTPPGKNTVDEGDESDDDKKCTDNHTSNLDTEPGTVGESVETVDGLVVLILGDDDASGGKGLLLLGITEFTDGEGSRDTHHARRDQSLRIDTHVTSANTSRNGRKTRGHDLMNLSPGEMGHKWLDQHGRLSLADEGRGSGDNGFGTGHAHGPEEEDGELANEPLDEAIVEQELDQGHEEDDGRDDTEEEEGLSRNFGSRQEGSSVRSEVQKLTS